MSILTPHGLVTTRLDFSQGDGRPTFVQVAVAYPPGQRQPALTEALAKEMMADVKRQMAPEFEVMGEIERIHGGLALFFIITETTAIRRPDGKRR